MQRLPVFFFAAFLAVFAGLLVGSRAWASPYQQVVDNSTTGRFSASADWSSSSYSSQRYGANYAYTKPGEVSDPARFKVRIPLTAEYDVYAFWPSNAGYNSSTPVGIRTTSGIRWVRVDQRANGGRWNYLGTFSLPAGDAYSVRFSRRTKGSGYVVADAVKIVSSSGESPQSGFTGQDVVTEARSWLGVPYVYGGASRSGVDCSGLTMRVFGRFGVYLPHFAADQYRYGTAVASPAEGDLVFGSFSGGSDVTHVGVAVGNGQMIHAPYPGTVVRYDPIYEKYSLGYRRLTSR